MSDVRPVTVIDYGIGNVRSVLNMLERVGAVGVLEGDPAEIAAARTLILPGVGAFDAGMHALDSRGLSAAIRTAAASGAQVLGICLGAQLLLESSEEGSAAGLGLVPGRVRGFSGLRIGLPVPHMGWNVVRPRAGAPLFDGVEGEQRFYFTHSYYMDLADAADVSATAEYGIAFDCAFMRGSVAGVQFHPEKSHRFGMALFERFVASGC